jgi:hypothetical protein
MGIDNPNEGTWIDGWRLGGVELVGDAWGRQILVD